MIKLTFAILISLSLLITPGFVFADNFNLPAASDGQINESLGHLVPVRLLPDHNLYFTITVKETITRLFQPSSAKRSQFDLILAGKRLKEAHSLISKNDIKNAAKSLKRYSSQMNKMGDNLEKARSQNQEITTLIAQMPETLKDHEVLLYSINQFSKDNKEMLGSLKSAMENFEKSVMLLDSINPGIKDRFKSVQQVQVQTQVSTEEIIEATKSTDYKPRRIIY